MSGGRRIVPAAALRGSFRPPSDKSVSHRAALLGAMAGGRSRVRGYLDAGDTRSTLAAVTALGAGVERDPGGELAISGAGLRGARPAAIDVGNAGTLLRILPGWLAGQPRGEWLLDGDASIRRRPVDRVAAPLRTMGARVRCRAERYPPLGVTAAQLHGTRHEPAVASAQVKSCLLLAGLLADGPTTVAEAAPTRDHTERMLAAAGARVATASLSGGGHEVTVQPAERLEPLDLEVPGDLSSAAFALVAALLVPGSEVAATGVGVNPTRTGLLAILERMGAAIEVEPGAAAAGEPVATVRARHSALRGTVIGGAEVPLAIDELPLVALCGCFAEGETRITDAAELRHKESDRIAAVAAALTALGGEVEAAADGLVIAGRGGLRGGTVDAAGDHRIAMLGAVAGLASREGVEVRGIDAAAVSYPAFESDLAALARG